MFEEGVEIDTTISVQFEMGKDCTAYVQSHTSITEIGLKDDKGQFHELAEGDKINLQNGVMTIGSKRVALNHDEFKKYRNIVRYQNGIVCYKYKDSYINDDMIL